MRAYKCARTQTLAADKMGTRETEVDKRVRACVHVCMCERQRENERAGAAMGQFTRLIIICI